MASSTRKWGDIFKKIFSKNFRANFPNITYLHKHACSSFIIKSRIIIRISDERVWHPLQENEAILKKYIFKNFRSNFRKFTYLHKSFCSSFIINSRIIIRISDERAWHPLQENETIFTKNIYIFQFYTEFSKNYVLAYFITTCATHPLTYIRLTFRKKLTFCLIILRYWW